MQSEEDIIRALCSSTASLWKDAAAGTTGLGKSALDSSLPVHRILRSTATLFQADFIPEDSLPVSSTKLVLSTD